MKINSHLSYQLNFLYKRFISTIFVFISMFTYSLEAISLSGIYSSSCQREVGVIMDVDDSKVKILNLDGEIKEIRRFDIIYIAHYPLGKLEIQKVEPSKDIKIVDIKTLYKNRVVDLVKGWMINYSENKISFLTIDGIETVIDTDNVWDISLIEQKETIVFNSEGQLKRFNFVHPYPFSSCEKPRDDMSNLNIYPQHLLETPLLIKTELDRLQLGHEEIESYVNEKVFYSKPQIHTNITTLGLWSSTNLRYGSSSTRNSNFIPVVRNELSEGLYKFQRVIVTGAAPMPYSVHEEPQTQFYYSMKSSYFHMSFMYDLNQLITSDYRWKLKDLDTFDDRQNEKMHLGGGFDYGNFSLEYSTVTLNYALRHNSLFHSDTMYLDRFGFFYTNRFVKISLYIGHNSPVDEEEELLVPEDDAKDYEIEFINSYNEELLSKQGVNMDYNYYRLNIDFASVEEFTASYSFIYKKMDFEKEPDADGLKSFIYKSESFTNAVYLDYAVKEEDIYLKGFVSVEIFKNRSGIVTYTDKLHDNYYKGGVSLGLVF